SVTSYHVCVCVCGCVPQELEGSVEGWPELLLQLCELKESLSPRLRPHDLSVLQERLDLLHSQWDEISHQVHTHTHTHHARTHAPTHPRTHARTRVFKMPGFTQDLC